MKYILIIGDGMADNAVEDLGGKTPLQAAHKPAIDELASKSEVGTVRTIPHGIPAGSDTGILSIFGYDPRKFYTGRSPLEAAGCGVKLMAGDVSYRANMVALSDDGLPFEERTILSHSGGSIEGEQSIGLMKYLMADETFFALTKKHSMSFHLNPSFRHIAVQRGANVTGLQATPPHDILNQKIGQYLPSGSGSAPLRELMEAAHLILDKAPINEQRRNSGHLPANGIWFWAEGTVAQLPSFFDLYQKTGSAVSAVPLVFGIAALGGVKTVEVEGATGELETNYAGKVSAALDALKNGDDFVCIHIEAPDECTHAGDLEGKLQAIEYLSERVVKPVVQGMDSCHEPYRLLLISDHKTLMSSRTHDGEPVPYLLYDSTNSAKTGCTYDEPCGIKGMFIEEGHTILTRLIKG